MFSRDSKGTYFHKSQTTVKPTPRRNAQELEHAMFNPIMKVEVTGEMSYDGIFKVKSIDDVNSGEKGTNTHYTVEMLNPYFTHKSARLEGSDAKNFQDSQTAAGMVLPSPQVGTIGVIIVADNQINRGYWIGSLPGPSIGKTVPDFSSTGNIAAEKSKLDEYAVASLPVGEYVRKTNDGSVPYDKIKHPIHPFADVLKQQGLLVDTVRGQTTSSRVRDFSPSMFGFNTPGRTMDKKDLIGFGENKVEAQVTRQGGHTFTMDDGDIIGQNNLVRLRSSKGAQILFHDTQDLVYIANQKGTAWIEMTADGKIDVYAKDSISFHTETDFNFRADRDVNLEAGRNINLKSNERTQIESKKMYLYSTEEGRIQVNGPIDFVTNDMRLNVTDFNIQSNNIDITNKLDYRVKTGEHDFATFYGTRFSTGTGFDIKTNAVANQVWAPTWNPLQVYNKGQTVIFNNLFYQAIKLTKLPAPANTPAPPTNAEYWLPLPPQVPKTVLGGIKVDTNGPLVGKIDISSLDSITAQSIRGKIDLKATADIDIQSLTTVYIDGTAAVHLNLPGPGAAVAEPIALSALATNIPIPFNTSAEMAYHVAPLGLYINEKIDSTKEWTENYRKDEEGIYSIMKRVPTFEPWPMHEGADKTLTDRTATDRGIE